MDFIPFQAPQSDHHPLNTGLSTENGVTAKGLIDGVNAYFKHLFGLVEDKVGSIAEAVDKEARDAVIELESQVAALQARIDGDAGKFAELQAQITALSIKQPVFATKPDVPPKDTVTEVDPVAAAIAAQVSG